MSASAIQGFFDTHGWGNGFHDSTAVGNLLFFSATSTTNFGQSGLWRSDGTTAGTFQLAPGSPGTWANVGGTLFFSEFDFSGSGLWKTDGTQAGTMKIKDVSAQSMVNVNGTLFFTAAEGTQGYEIWRSDGTAGGTTMVSNVNSGQNLWDLRDLTNVDGRLFFSAGPGWTPNGASGNQLWESDGTPSGTHLVTNLDSNQLDDYYNDFVAVGDTLFFAEHDGHKSELWRSDGTAAGTVVLKTFQANLGEALVTDLVAVGNTLFFVGDDSTHGRQLWKTDGTAAGTTLVTSRELGLGSRTPGIVDFAGATPADLTNVGGTLFFDAGDGAHGRELWKSDGSDAGTVMVKDINPGPGGSAPAWLTDVNGTAFFTANDGTHGLQLWRSDGTSAGTFQLGTVTDDQGGLSPAHLTNVNGVLLFAADIASGNPQVWRSDGTSSGTTPISNQPFQPATAYPIMIPFPVAIPRAALSAASPNTLFAINPDGMLYRYDASGWTPLHDQIDSVSAVTSGAGPNGPVVFAVTRDRSLLRYDAVSGWQTIGAPGTISGISSGTDVNGRADVFVLTTAGDFTQWRDGSGWSPSMIGGRGSIATFSTGANGRVVVTTNDASIFEYDPWRGWFRLSSANFATGVSLTNDATGQEVLFARTNGSGLFRHDFAGGWQRLGADGTVFSISAGVDAAGKATVVVFTTAQDLAEHDDVTGWSLVQTPDRLSEASSPMAGAGFVMLEDGSVFARDASGLYTRLTSPGF